MRWWDGSEWTSDTYERSEPLEDWGRSAATTRTVRTATAGAAGPTTEDGALLARWWLRAGARIVDSLVTSTVALLLVYAQARPYLDWVSAQLDNGMRGAGGASPAPLEGAALRGALALSAATLLVSFAYQLAFLLWRGATPGKMLFGLRVRPWRPDARLNASMVTRRCIAYDGASALSGISLLSYAATLYLVLDLLWPLRDPRRQALHDKFAGTCVVVASTDPTRQAQSPQD